MDNTQQVSIQRMELAARNVDRALAVDCAAPKLTDLMNINQQNPPTASGLTDYDYPILSSFPSALANMPQIRLTNKIPLPPEILEHFGHIQCHCMMGLFPEINRAWLTVDSDIYVWTFEENADLAYFDGLNETILCVGLVQPKLGDFHNFIKKLLILITSIDIIILGVTFNNNNEIQLIPEPIFTIPTDGVTYSTITHTMDGRLFLGSKDGCLYEILYYAESSWFGKRFKKINRSTSKLSFLVPSFLNAALNDDDGIVQIVVDNSRHILYVLTEKGAIEVYDLGEKGDSFSKITSITQGSLVNKAVNIVKTLDSQNFRPIVSISAVELNESNDINLVAVTQTGVRFYLSTKKIVSVMQSQLQPQQQQQQGEQQQQSQQRPYSLDLVHVRLPPGYSANITVRPRSVHLSHYNQRNLILLSTVNDKDVLWCINSDLFPFSTNLMESYTTLNLDSCVLAIAELYETTPIDDLYKNDNIPLVINQHYKKQQKFVVLTSQGCYIFTKLRPVDILKKLLKDNYGPDNDLVKTYFMIQKEDQACATALIIACLDIDENIELAESAIRAFFLYGGEPRLSTITTPNQSTFLSGSMFSPNLVSTPLPQQLYQQQQPQQQSFTNHLGFDINSPFVFSAKHNGLYLYLGRILRPIWHRCCIEKISIDHKTIISCSSVSNDCCIWILNCLTTLHNFLLTNTQLSIGDGGVISQDNQQNRLNHTTVQDAQLEERLSLNSLKIFVCHCCQVIGLWKILCEHQFHILINQLTHQQQELLQNTTFKDLFLYGQNLCTSLIQTLIDNYLNDNASVDSISNKLREICPLLYKIEDATFSKASELLKSTNTLQNIDEKEDMLKSALQLCKSIAPNLNLPIICKQFVALKAYTAVIDLCTTCSKKIDPDNIAGHYYKETTTNSNATTGDQEGQEIFHKRLEIYKEIFNMLDVLYNENPAATGLNITNSQINDSNSSDSKTIIVRIINEILEYPDDILHVSLYDWMMSKQMINDLIKVNNPSLETYLLHTSHMNPDNVDILDLLWKYYENNNNHAAAAKILDNLASKPGSSLKLKDRLECLTRAIMCMRSGKIGYAPYLGVFSRDLEDKMEVAKVQEQILEILMTIKDTRPDADEAINALNSNLYQISQLYENFAQPFELWECQLSIINCAGYMDENLIERIWKNILRREVRNSIGTPNNRLGQILSKVKQIARQCGIITNHCFPLAFLISELEQLATYLKADTSLVPLTLITMELAIDLLLEIYNRLIATMSEVQIWQKEENEFHLFEAIAALITAFLNDHESYNSVQKRKIISQCQDTVASILSILYSKPNTDQLVNVLRGIQSRLSRL